MVDIFQSKKIKTDDLPAGILDHASEMALKAEGIKFDEPSPTPEPSQGQTVRTPIL
jgi:transcription initiation factor TFIID TATA-box-binding protein